MYTVKPAALISSSNMAFIWNGMWRGSCPAAEKRTKTVVRTALHGNEGGFHRLPFNVHGVISPEEVELGEEFFHPDAID